MAFIATSRLELMAMRTAGDGKCDVGTFFLAIPDGFCAEPLEVTDLALAPVVASC